MFSVCPAEGVSLLYSSLSCCCFLILFSLIIKAILTMATVMMTTGTAIIKDIHQGRPFGSLGLIDSE